MQELEVGVDRGRFVEARLVGRAVQVEDGTRGIGDLRGHALDALSELLLGLLAVRVPWGRVGPAGGDHREAVDVDHPTFAELYELGPPDHVVDLHLIVVAGRHIAANAGATQLFGRHAHPALDPFQHHFLKTRGAFARVAVELVQAIDAHAQRAVALAPDVGLDLADLLGRDGLMLAAEGDTEMTVLGDDRHDRFAGHVSAAAEHAGVVAAGRVEELLPADLGTVQVGHEKYFWHLPPIARPALFGSRARTL